MNSPAGGPTVLAHLVSRGYQQNFATEDKRVSVLDVATGRVIDRHRPIKSNFVAPDFTAFVDASGAVDQQLERDFARIERVVLDQTRRVAPDCYGPDQQGAIINLLAVHLVRSAAFKVAHDVIVSQVRDDDLPGYEDHEQLKTAFARQYGRPPRPGEIREIAVQQLTDRVGSNEMLVDSMARNHDRMVDFLNAFHVQLVTLKPTLPGFILGDVPVVHGHSATNRFGFRNHLAIGDSDLIIAPLTDGDNRPLSPDVTAAVTTIREARLANGGVFEAAHPSPRRPTAGTVDRGDLRRHLSQGRVWLVSATASSLDKDSLGLPTTQRLCANDRDGARVDDLLQRKRPLTSCEVGTAVGSSRHEGAWGSLSAMKWIGLRPEVSSAPKESRHVRRRLSCLSLNPSPLVSTAS
jgi:hypothetical protein